MSFTSLLLSDLVLALNIVGVGFLFRFGMFGFDCFRCHIRDLYSRLRKV